MRKFIVVAGIVGILLHGTTEAAATAGKASGSSGQKTQLTTYRLASLASGAVIDLPKNIKVQTPPDPPMGQEYAGAAAMIVPAGVTWRPVAFTFNIDFDESKTGTGNVSMVIRDAAGVAHLRIPLANGLDRASRYVDFSGWSGAPQGPSNTIDHECIVASIPDVTLPAGWQITTLLDGRKSTDRVKEMHLWVEEEPA
jgi:hypothetical protein